MVIGIDASRAFVGDKTGTENYSYHLIRHMLRVPESATHTFVLFTRQNSIIPPFVLRRTQNYGGVRPDCNVVIVPIKMEYLWTQIGLALCTWRKFQIPSTNNQTNRKLIIQNSKRSLDVLWVPSHTLPILRKPGIKTVVTIHGLEYQWLPEYRNWLQRWYLPLSTYYAAKYATRLIAVSDSTKNDLLREIKTDAKKIKVIWEGVEQEFSNRKFSNSQMTKIWEEYGLQKGKFVLFVGTIQPRKNLVSLIQAWAEIEAGLPDHKLVIAGGVGWMAGEVLFEPTRLGIGDKIVFTGRVDDLVLRALYQGAGIYVQPSWTEGFGLPVLEAMQAGVVVVASDGGALREVVGDAGVVVPLGHDFVTKLAVAIKRLIIDNKLREKMIARGYKRGGEFDWAKAAKETLLYITGEGDSKNI